VPRAGDRIGSHRACLRCASLRHVEISKCPVRAESTRFYALCVWHLWRI
jgi:hypothetical protein